MELIEIVEDITRARQELAALTDMDPARLQLCDSVVSNLENEIENTVLRPWIPATYPMAQGAIIGTLDRIKEVEQMIVDAAPGMLVRKLPDEMIRFGVAQLT